MDYKKIILNIAIRTQQPSNGKKMPGMRRTNPRPHRQEILLRPMPEQLQQQAKKRRNQLDAQHQQHVEEKQADIERTEPQWQSKGGKIETYIHRVQFQLHHQHLHHKNRQNLLFLL